MCLLTGSFRSLLARWPSAFCTLALAFYAALALQPVRCRAQQNLTVNSSFDQGIANWSGAKVAPDGIVAAPEMLSWETADTWNGSAGALRLTIQPEEGFLYHSHNSGAVATLSEGVPADSTLRVEFSAKVLNGPLFLNVSKHGGGGQEQIPISTSWQRYVVYVYIFQATQWLVFNPIDLETNYARPLLPSTLLLDDVRVSVVEGGYANLLANGHFEGSTLPWRGQLEAGGVLTEAPELIGLDGGDASDGTVSMHLAITKDPSKQYPTDSAGAVAPLRVLAPAGSILRIRFSAKTIGGAEYMSITPVAGGPQVSVHLTPAWTAYDLKLRVDQDTTELVFSILDAPSSVPVTAADGAFRIDDVDVRIVGVPQDGLVYQYRADHCVLPTDPAGSPTVCSDVRPLNQQRMYLGTGPVPTLNSSSTGGSPALVASAGTVLQTTGLPGAVGSFTMAYVLKKTTTGTSDMMWEEPVPGTGIKVRYRPNLMSYQDFSSAGIYELNGLSAHAPQLASFSDVGQLMMVRGDSTGSELWIDGVLHARGDHATPAVSLNAKILAVGTGETVELSEVVAYDHRLTDADVALLYEALGNRYGINRLKPTFWFSADALKEVRDTGTSPTSGYAFGAPSNLIFDSANGYTAVDLTAGLQDAPIEQFGNSDWGLRFNGEGEYFALSSAGNVRDYANRPDQVALTDFNGEYTVTIVANCDVGAHVHDLFEAYMAAADPWNPSWADWLTLQVDGTTGTLRYGKWGDAATYRGAGECTVLCGHPFVVSLRASASAGSNSLFVNGTKVYEDAGPVQRVGFSPYFGDTFKGLLADVTIHLHPLSDGEVAAHQQALVSKFGISPVVSCQAPDVCGDGVVSGAEVCDPGADPLCAFDCGSEQDALVECDPAQAQASCGPGQVCGLNNGGAFGLAPYQSYCWPASCATDAADYGVTGSCGLAPCTSSCAGAACGVANVDACGDTCAGTCADGQEGCTGDPDCRTGSVCISEICRPERCLDADVRQAECGDSGEACGPCSLLLVGSKCSTQECGVDEFGNTCGACGSGATCNAGTCVALGNVAPTEATALVTPSTSGAGALRGNFTVDDQGNATYSVPLTIPPGRGGVQPNLSLNYSSAGGRSHVGDGWSLSGVQSISRCPQTFADDGQMRAVKFDAADAFCLNGRRLHLLNDTSAGDIPLPYGARNTEYRTEPDTFLRVFARGDGDGEYSEPAYFEAKDNFGRVYLFGKTPDAKKWVTSPSSRSRATLIWYLNEIRDLRDNAISYIYQQSILQNSQAVEATKGSAGAINDPLAPFVEEVKLVSIEYPPYHRIAFEYESVPRARYHGARYWAGVETNLASRLTQISTWAGNTPVVDYRLHGEIKNNSWRLLSLEKCASDVCLDPIAFQYGSGATIPEYVVTPTPAGDPPAGESTMYWQLASVDADRDGREDLFYSKFKVDRSGLRGYQQLDMVYRLSTSTGDLGPEQTSNLRADCDGYSSFDFEGDGRLDDLFLTCLRDNPDDPADPTPNDHRKGVFVAVHQGGGQFEHIQLDDIPPTHRASGLAFGRVLLGDLDGDGYKDLVSCQAVTPAQANSAGFDTLWNVRLRNPTSREFHPAQEVARLPGTWCFDDHHVVSDIDGDGDEEVLLRTSEEGSVEDPRKLTISHGVISAERGVPHFENGPAVPASDHSQDAIAGFVGAVGRRFDANGDGLADAVQPTRDGLMLILNTGATFVYHGAASRPAWYDSAEFAFEDAFILDQDGDGRDEYFFPVKNLGRYAMYKPLLEKDGDIHQVDESLSLTSIPYMNNGIKWRLAVVLRNHVDGTTSIMMRGNSRTDATFDKFTSVPRSVNKLYSATEARTKTVFVRYDGGSYSPNSDSICGGPACLAGAPSPTVSTVSWSSGGTTRRSTFSYEDARLDKTRLAVTGFGRVVRSDYGTQEIERVLTTKYHNGPYNGGWVEFAGLPESVEESVLVKGVDGSFVGEHVTRSEFAWATARSDAGFRFHYVATRSEQISDNGNITVYAVTESPNVDAFGNSLGSTTYWDDGRASNFEVTYAPESGPTADALANNLRSLPHRQVYERSDNGNYSRVVTDTSYFYDSGLVAAVTRRDTDSTQAGAPVESLPTRSFTSWTYWPSGFGAIKTVTKFAPDAPVQASLLDYDESFTYLTAVHNGVHAGLGLPETKVWFDPVNGALRWIKSPAGDTQTFNFDGFGRLREALTSGGANRQWDYLNTGLRSWESMAVRESGAYAPVKTSYLFDDGQTARVVTDRPRSLSVVVENEYDQRRRLRRVSVPRFAGAAAEWTVLEYDTLDRIARVTAPAIAEDGTQQDAVVSYSYLPRATTLTETSIFAKIAPRHAYVQTIQDSGGAFHYVMYDGHGNAVGSLDAAGTATRNDYDGWDRLVAVKVDSGAGWVATSMHRDSTGAVTGITDADRGQIDLVYDGLGQLTSSTQGGNTVIFGWDGLGRVVSASAREGVTKYSWDVSADGAREHAGALLEVMLTRPAGDVDGYSFEYEGPDGAPTRVLTQIGLDRYSTSFGYDGAALGMITWPDGTKARYVRDDSGRVTEVRDADGEDTEAPWWRAEEWDAFGNVVNASYGLGFSAARGVDARTGLLTSQNTNGLISPVTSAYAYDVRGSLRAKDRTQVREEFVPDAIGRLQGYTRKSGGVVEESTTFNYDKLGNLDFGTESVNGGAPTTWRRFYESDKPRAVQSTSEGDAFHYDDGGNQWLRVGPSVRDGRQYIVYTSFGLPERIESGAESEPPVATTTFDYDPFQRRLEKVVDTQAGDLLRTRYPVDGYMQVLADGRSTSVLKVPFPDGTHLQRFRDLNVSDSVALVDQVGSVVGLVRRGASGLETVEAGYDAYGFSDTPIQPWGFVGVEEDTDLGLVNASARMYDSRHKAFLSPDPVLSEPLWGAVGSSSYAYGFNAPHMFADPSGLTPSLSDPCDVCFDDEEPIRARGTGRAVEFSDLEAGVISGRASGVDGRLLNFGNSDTNFGSLDGGWAAGWDGAPRMNNQFGVADGRGNTAVPRDASGGDLEVLRARLDYERNVRGVLYDPRTAGIIQETNERWRTAFIENSAMAMVPWGRILRGVWGVAAARGAANVVGREAGGALLRAATQPFKSTPFTLAGRALTKHPEVIGLTKETLNQTLRSPAAINAAAEGALGGILRSGTTALRDTPRFGPVVDVIAESGFGARFSQAGEFITFLNP